MAVYYINDWYTSKTSSFKEENTLDENLLSLTYDGEYDVVGVEDVDWEEERHECHWGAHQPDGLGPGGDGAAAKAAGVHRGGAAITTISVIYGNVAGFASLFLFWFH